MPRALKVFRYSDGFHAWTVAAPSRAKAIAAWGMSRDLFRDGLAEEIEDGPDHAAALAEPGVAVKRGLLVDVGKVETTRPAKAKPGPSANDRARMKALEAQLEALDEAHAAETAALEAEREAVDRKAAGIIRSQTRARDALKARLKAARARLN